MEIVIILLLILLNGLLAMSEVALISARRSQLKIRANQGDKAALYALRLAEDPDKFLSTVQIGITLIGILTGIYSGEAFAGQFGKIIADVGIPLNISTDIAQVIIIITVTYLTIVFGELVPKRIGLSASERVAVAIARPMRLLAHISSPFVWLLSHSVRSITHLLRLKEAETKVTEAEIKSIVREGMEDGEVQKVEEQIVGRVFSLGDRRVGSIMTHRSEIVWIEVGMSHAEIRDLVACKPHNLYPVAADNLDRVAGVIYLKDLFTHINDERFDIRKLLQPAKFFHENIEVYSALDQLRNEQVTYGLICDEFGVTQGIVTLRDIFEALVGSMPEQREEPDIVVRDDGSRLIDGQCSFYDFLAHYGLEDTYSPGGYNTLSGLILDKLEHIPQTGEKMNWDAFTFEIVDMDGARIDKVLVYNKKQISK